MKIREITSGLQFPEGPVALADGSIVLVEIARGTLSRVTPDGRISVVAQLGGGPNGAAIGPDGQCYVCNNGGFAWHRDPEGFLRPIAQAADYSGGRIERVNLATGKFDRVYDRAGAAAGDPGLRGPNDIVFDAHGGFWFTDLGKARPRELDRGGIYYARADGSLIREIAHPVLTPNGIGLSPDGKTVYFAETAGARLWALDINGARLVAQPGGVFQGFDSLKVDSKGNILVATLFNGGVTTISPDGKSIVHMPMPDRYTTNVCFGGPELTTLYVTLSGTGKLVAIDHWPIAGLRLNNQ
jgi:gluconolactonase